MKPGPKALPPEQRFLPQIERGAGCWLYTGRLKQDGYGMFAISSGRTVLAHRFAYELFVGPIPEGMQVDHVKARGCTNRHCVNPAHLELVTFEENMRRTRETHCSRGHAYDATYRTKSGVIGQRCRACNRLTTQARRANRTPEQVEAERQWHREHRKKKKDERLRAVLAEVDSWLVRCQLGCVGDRIAELTERIAA